MMQREEIQYINTHTRYGRGFLLADAGNVLKVKDAKTKLWKVGSATDPDKAYNVLLRNDERAVTCDCPDYEMRGEVCKHIYAMIIQEVNHYHQ